MNAITTVNEYTAQAYFYADSSLTLGDVSKKANEAIFVTVDYRKLVTSVNFKAFSFVMDVGTNPPLVVSSAQLNSLGNVLTFILSGGFPGVTYNLSVGVDTRTDVLTVDVPAKEQCPDPGTLTNVAALAGTQQVVFINSAPRYFIAPFTPSGAAVMDQWFNPETGILSEFITDGNITWWRPFA